MFASSPIMQSRRKTMRRLISPVLLLLLSAASLPAQWAKVPTPVIPRSADGKPNLSAPAPRLADGKPDLSGVWEPAATKWLRNLGADLKPEDIPFQPWAKTVYDERAAGLHWREEPDANCLPQGVPKILVAPAPWKVVQTPNLIVFVHEAFNLWRQVFLDGRELAVTEDTTPTWMGYSTGKWEGDTLVVETRGFNGKVWLDQLGKPSTEALHVTERFKRKDFGHMDIDITIDDPKAYTKPWSVTVGARLAPNTELMEFICLENEKDVGRKSEK
jgi:hypothetical protein